MPKLKVEITSKISESYDVHDGMTIGRAETNDIVLLDGSISRVHAKIQIEGDRVAILDNRSSNGVVVNGKKVEKKALNEGDVLRLGIKTIHFTVESPVKENPDFIVDLTKKPLASYPMKEILASPDVLLIIPTIEPLMEMIYEIAAQMVIAGGLPEEAQKGMIFAVQEAVRNGAKHGNRFDPGKVLRFRYARDAYKVVALIEDQGPGFDYKAVLEKAKEVGRKTEEREKALESGAEGAGVLFMLASVDRVEFNRQGNQVILTKVLTSDKEDADRLNRDKWNASGGAAPPA